MDDFVEECLFLSLRNENQLVDSIYVQTQKLKECCGPGGFLFCYLNPQLGTNINHCLYHLIGDVPTSSLPNIVIQVVVQGAHRFP